MPTAASGDSCHITPVLCGEVTYFLRAAFGLAGALAGALRLAGTLCVSSFFFAHAALPLVKHHG